MLEQWENTMAGVVEKEIGMEHETIATIEKQSKRKFKTKVTKRIKDAAFTFLLVDKDK